MPRHAKLSFDGSPYFRSAGKCPCSCFTIDFSRTHGKPIQPEGYEFAAETSCSWRIAKRCRRMHQKCIESGLFTLRSHIPDEFSRRAFCRRAAARLGVSETLPGRPKRRRTGLRSVYPVLRVTRAQHPRQLADRPPGARRARPPAQPRAYAHARASPT